MVRFNQRDFNMQIKPIRTEDDYKSALARVREIWDAEDGTPESDELDILALLIEAYGDKHYPVVPPDPIDEIEYRLQEIGMAQEYIDTIIDRIHELAPSFPQSPERAPHASPD